jgi:hypothetical protein
MRKIAISIVLSVCFSGAVCAQDIESAAAGAQNTAPAAAPKAAAKTQKSDNTAAPPAASTKQKAVIGDAATKNRTPMPRTPRRYPKKKSSKTAAAQYPAQQSAVKKSTDSSSQIASIMIDNNSASGSSTITYAPNSDDTADADTAAEAAETPTAAKTIPASYGPLKGVVPTDAGAMLFFEDETGTIHTAQVKSSGKKASVELGATIERSEK